MGLCLCKSNSAADDAAGNRPAPASGNGIAVKSETPVHPSAEGTCSSSYPVAASPLPNVGPLSASPLPAGVSPSPARSTPRWIFRGPFPPPSPAKHIKAALAKRQGRARPKEKPIPEDGGGERPLDKSFGYSRNFVAKYELGKEVGRGHFGHTCSAWARKGEIKGQLVAVKVISKAKMTTAIAIEDVRREVKILKALAGHKHLIKFYDACEDTDNVYIVMELCEGGELLDRILSRGGRYTEEDAKATVVQILSVVAFCHLQGVVHRDLKPENFLFTTKDQDAPMKVIDFGLSDFIKPDMRLNDIVGSAYYVAPEVLHRSYAMEADIWSIGVITYILLCGSRPFWARTESAIFRAVLRADPNFDDAPWPSLSPEAKDFVKRLLNKDHRKRMTAAQALAHPWLRVESQPIPLDILIYKLVRSYLHSSPLKRAALKALSRALTEDELFYLRSQFRLLEPSKDGMLTLANFRLVCHCDYGSMWACVPLFFKSYRVSGTMTFVLKIIMFSIVIIAQALMRNATDAMKESRVLDILNTREYQCLRQMDFDEFCAASISTYQLEVLESWEKIASAAFQYFEEDGNRVLSINELAREMNLGPASHAILRDWIRQSDRKLSFVGYTKFLHGITLRSSNTRHQ